MNLPNHILPNFRSMDNTNVYDDNWNKLGKLSNYVETLAATGSISTILAISFERYYAICKPLKAGYKCTRLRATIIICFIWLLSCLLTSPILFMAKSNQVRYRDDSLVQNCILETDSDWAKTYVFGSIFAFFCLPLLVLMLVYWLISRRLIRENVAMLDSTNRSLTDSRGNIAHASHTPLADNKVHHHMSLNLPLFRRPNDADKRKPTSPLSSFFNSIRHYNYCGHSKSQQGIGCSNQDATRSAEERRIGSVLLAQPQASMRVIAQRSVDTTVNSGHLRPLVVGKALSLDYGASRITGINNDNHANGSTAAVRASGQTSTWARYGIGNGKAALAANIRQRNERLSDADVTTTATTTTSSTTTTDIDNLRTPSSSPPSTRKASLPSWVLSTNLVGFVGRLLSIGNLSTRFKGTPAGNDRSESQDKRGDHDSRRSGQWGDVSSTGNHHQGRKNFVDLNMSSTLCDTQLINKQSNFTTKKSENELEAENDLSMVPLMHSAKSRCKGNGHDTSISKNYRPDVTCHVNQDNAERGDIMICDMSTERQEEGNIQTGITSPSLRRTKRYALESKKKRQDSHYARSRFKWFKGFSVSSSTGSTYTNSTFLSSDAGSISQSSRQQSTPSPPRPIIMHRTASTNADSGLEADFYQIMSTESPLDATVAAAAATSASPRRRSCSPDRAPPGDRRKIAHFNEVVGVGEIDLTSSLSFKPIQSTHDAPIRVANSESSTTVRCNETGNSSSSDRSLSPAAWLDSMVFHDQHDEPNQHQRWQQHHRVMAQQHHQLSQQDEEQTGTGATSTVGTDDKIELNEEAGGSALAVSGSVIGSGYFPCRNSTNLRGIDGTTFDDLHKEITKEQGLVSESIARQISTCASSKLKPSEDVINGNFGLSGGHLCVSEQKFSRDHCGQGNAGTIKEEVVRSFTEDQERTGAEQTRLFPIDGGLAPLHSQCNSDFSPSSRHSGRYSIVNAHKHISKVNLVAMAHNISDNLHLKRHNRRSGSHPIVSHQMHVQSGSTSGMHTDYLAVRDVSKRQQMDSRRQVVAMLAFVVVCFFTLFFPYRLFTIWLILSSTEQVQSLGMETYYNINFFCRILIYLHSAINPIAYNLISTKFRRAFMSILLCRGSATRRNFTADPHRFPQHDSKGQTNNQKHGSTATVNGNGGGSRGTRSPKAPTLVTK